MMIHDNTMPNLTVCNHTILVHGVAGHSKLIKLTSAETSLTMWCSNQSYQCSNQSDQRYNQSDHLQLWIIMV